MFFSLCKWNIQYFSSPPQRTGGSQDIDPNDRVLPSGTPACCVSEKQKTGSLMFILLLFCSVCGVKSHQQEDRVSDWRTASCCCCWFIHPADPDKHLFVISDSLINISFFVRENAQKRLRANYAHTTQVSLLGPDLTLIVLKPFCWLRSSLTSMAVICYLCWGGNEPPQPQRASASQGETESTMSHAGTEDRDTDLLHPPCGDAEVGQGLFTTQLLI